jgi:hypothetical protein
MLCGGSGGGYHERLLYTHDHVAYCGYQSEQDRSANRSADDESDQRRHFFIQEIIFVIRQKKLVHDTA